MSSLPNGWAAARFGQLFDFKGGSQPPKATFAAQQLPGYVRLLQIRDFESDAKAVFVKDDLRWPKCSTNDIMVGRYGASVGKILTGKSGAYNVALVKMHFERELLDASWVRQFLLSDYFQEPLRRISRSAQNGFNKTDLEEIDVSLPPLAEQRRIAAKMDSLSVKSKRARDNLDHIPRLVEKYKQAILEAVIGGVGAKTARWDRTTVATVASSIFDGPFGSNLKSSDYTSNGVRVVRLENISHLKFIEEKEAFISFDTYQTLKQHTLEPCDILFSSFIADQIRVCLFPRGLPTPAINKADCFCIRVNPNLCHPRFLLFRLACQSTFEQLSSTIHGITRPRISLSQLKTLEFELPSFAEQNEIVDHIETGFTWINRLANEATNARKLIDHLDQAVLAKAFRGDLVPQDPNDEPASVLLERIKAQQQTKAPRDRKIRRATGPRIKHRVVP